MLQEEASWCSWFVVLAWASRPGSVTKNLEVLVQDVVEKTGLLWPVVAATARKADMAQVAQEQELGSATGIKSGPFS